MTDRSYYDILNVTKDASDAIIKKSYRNLVAKNHPDKHPGEEEEYTQKFKEIQEAYNVLSNNDKRKLYDEHGKAGLDENGIETNVDLSDILKDFGMFGGGFGHHNREEIEEIIVTQELTLEQLFTGGDFTQEINRKCLCNKCKGTGSNDGKNYTCKTCNGRKIELQMIRMGPMIQQVQKQCSGCNGQGISGNFPKCTICSGTKYIDEKKVIKYNIPAGSIDKQSIVIDNSGNELPLDKRKNGKNYGPLKIVVIEKPHPLFKRYFSVKGQNNPANLLYQLDISLCESLTGFSRNIEHVNGELFTIKYDHIIKPGDIHIVSNKGMPRQNNPILKGNMYIQFNVQYPDTFKESEKAKIRQLFNQPNVKVKNTDEVIDTVDLDNYHDTYDENNDFDGNSNHQQQFRNFRQHQMHAGNGQPECRQQ